MKSLNPLGLVLLSVSEGATTPVPPNGVGSLAYSSTLTKIVSWNGTSWTSGTATTYQTEVNFGASGTRAPRTFTVANTAATLGLKVLAQQSADAATGKFADEAEFDTLDVIGSIATTGNVFFIVAPARGGNYLLGKFKINYTLG